MLHEFVAPQKNGVIRFPPAVRAALHLDEPGAQVEIIEEEPGVFRIRGRMSVPADQAWFWTERWQRMEREADEDVAAGRFTDFDSLDEFLADIDD